MFRLDTDRGFFDFVLLSSYFYQNWIHLPHHIPACLILANYDKFNIGAGS